MQATTMLEDPSLNALACCPQPDMQSVICWSEVPPAPASSEAIPIVKDTSTSGFGDNAVPWQPPRTVQLEGAVEP